MECPTGEFPIIPDPPVAIAVADEPDHHGASDVTVPVAGEPVSAAIT
jgi:hypothetical protein